jgi:bifunctional DNA-binding transcriptional regulator/antitoxin component of YhaV-PrlF toxin-antitoxin module
MKFVHAKLMMVSVIWIVDIMKEGVLMTLVPENTTRRVDGLGRITLPRGLRQRFAIDEKSEMEIYTMNFNGKNYICLGEANEIDDKYITAKNVLEELGVEVPPELLEKF